MKLIDQNKLDGCKLCTTDQFPCDKRVEGWNECIEYLQKCCTHVPVVEVVQCKDCKHWGTGYGGETEHVKVCEFANYMVGANGYCVYGERKMDAEVRDDA